jgi:hypothetical protein
MFRRIIHKSITLTEDGKYLLRLLQLTKTKQSKDNLRNIMEKSFGDIQQPQRKVKVSIDQLRLSRIRTRLFLIASISSFIWFVLKPFDPDRNNPYLVFFFEYIISIVVPGVIGISLAIGLTTYLIGLLLIRSEQDLKRSK